MRYQQNYDGQWYPQRMSGDKIMCCSCGLVHFVKYKKIGRKLFVMATKDQRATGQARRWMKKKGDNIKCQLTDNELAYIAGFFDGEGSITIHINGRKYSPRGVSPNHTLQVSIGNTDTLIPSWIQSVYGGSLTHRFPDNERCKRVTQWQLRCVGALAFLEDIYPHLKMKRPQAEIAMNYQRRKIMHGPRRLILKEIQWREKQRISIRALNRKGPRATAQARRRG